MTASSPPSFRRPEILAPAGDWECARAAVENGADAIYFGLERFNARMRARNFTLADLPSLMAFLHHRGVRGYVTFNTLVFTPELADAEDYLRAIITAGVDAAIVQDVGICRLIRQLSPDFPIHGSTQMTVTSAAGVAFASELGANLVVLARENSLADIARIQQAQQESGSCLPLEVFVHGALCVAYSGQCLTSESLGGRSANRGECAQACRLPYDLIADGAVVDLGDRRYLLSPQDLAGLDVIPDLIRQGIASLKIEGRLKSPEYVASITRVYRHAVDQAMASLAQGHAPTPGELAAPEARYEIQMTFSRGLYPGWFRGNRNQELAHARFGTKRGVFLGEVRHLGPDWISLRLAGPLKPGDGVVFDAGRPDGREEGGRVYQVEPGRPNAEETTLRFGRHDIDWRRVQVGQKVWKTSDPALERELRGTFAGDHIRFTRPLRVEAHGRAGSPLTLIADDLEGHFAKAESLIPLAVAERQPLTAPLLQEQLSRLGGTPFSLSSLKFEVEGQAILPVSEINRLRRSLVTSLAALRSAPRRWQLHAPSPSKLSPPVPLDDASASRAEAIAVIRLPEQLEPAWQAGIRTIYCEFENPKRYRDAVVHFRELQASAAAPAASIWLAPPRIFKPGEEWILQQVRSANPDGFLVRNSDHLTFYAGARMRGDFSLNVANPLTAQHFIERHRLERVTASYDLNISQLEALLLAAPPSWFDLTLHQHMPMFHMEHCVFCAFLSSGNDYRDCGRPCEKHRVSLRDRVGADLPLRADAGCRNTVYNNRAQTGAEYAGRLMSLGARSFRIEFVNEAPDEVSRTLDRYTKLLRGELSGADLWRELRLINQLGVTRGQMVAPPQLIHRKS